jgi:hypothetical protein
VWDRSVFLWGCCWSDRRRWRASASVFWVRLPWSVSRCRKAFGGVWDQCLQGSWTL